MRKRKFFLAALLFAVCFLFSGTTTKVQAAGCEYYLGGMPAGFTLSEGGAEVVGLNEVAAEDGLHKPAEKAGIKPGDCIVAIDDIAIKSIADLNSALERSNGKPVKLTVKRSGETAEVEITPVKDAKTGKFKLGVLIRDMLNGIGTVTYINKETLRFGALGHAVSTDNFSELGIADSKVYLCSIVGVNKGERGRAGELRGLFMNDQPIATADKVCCSGLYGTFNNGYDFSNLKTIESAPISEAKIGKACIYSTVDGICPEEYQISIVKVDANQKDNKNFVIKITDERLIGETGGIVQGMSGSPIVQNGKLIGAVTHVFLNDPTRGYGIGIEKMLVN
ncbi:MAG: PDZ domain-containing protein [Clostridia bacterium]|nr:PDZ domain-containing protein [Clostridia bacterium]